nr:hypothetical protein [Tanacetum cinerariifolium]
FIEDFYKIAKPLTVLTQKSKTFDWGEEQENAFQTLKDKFCNAPILALLDGPEDFVVYCDALGLGLGCVLMQRGKGSWDVHLPLVEFLYNNSYHSSMRCAPFEDLFGRKCRSLIMSAEFEEGQLIRPELVQKTNDKILQIKDRLKAARDRQKSYVDKRRKPLEFSVGPVAYRLDLPEELNSVHDTFQVSNLKTCLADLTLQVLLDEI